MRCRMLTCRASAVLVAVCLATGAAAGAGDPGDRGPADGAVVDGGAVDRGRAMAERMCTFCHMNPGQGEKDGPRGIPSFRAVANRPHQNLEGIVVWLRSVPPMMPDHHLTQDEIEILAQFIMSLRTTK